MYLLKIQVYEKYHGFSTSGRIRNRRSNRHKIVWGSGYWCWCYMPVKERQQLRIFCFELIETTSSCFNLCFLKRLFLCYFVSWSRGFEMFFINVQLISKKTSNGRRISICFVWLTRWRGWNTPLRVYISFIYPIEYNTVSSSITVYCVILDSFWLLTWLLIV